MNKSKIEDKIREIEKYLDELTSDDITDFINCLKKTVP
jgi:hypothetical protein